MAKSTSASSIMRIGHRYLGFFLVGIMAVYAISGTILIFRNTDFLKKEYTVEKQLEAGLNVETLGPALSIKNLEISAVENGIIRFANGSYNIESGMAVYTQKRLPIVLDAMTKLHKARSGDPAYMLNIFFGASLLFFVVSSFWMFAPKSKTFRQGMIFTAVGIVFTILVLLI